ncbi:MAG: DNA repair protein RecN [Pseudomonadota bacterium]
MLTHLHIQDFAIVDTVEIELQNGLSVLTGETGAGKSILIDALSLVLGNRADSGQVREGAGKADIAATFDITEVTAAREWLNENELDSDECILRRTIGADGRSRGYINGRVMPLQSMREIGEMLVDIHGQHEHQRLTRKNVQRDLLDQYAQNDALLGKLSLVYGKWRDACRALEAMDAGGDLSGQIDMLRYQLDELDALDLASETLSKQESDFARLSNAETLLTDCKRALDGLYESEQSVHAQLNHVSATMASLSQLDPALQQAEQTVREATVLCEDAAGELRRYSDSLEIDEQQLAQLDETISTLHTLSRKHQTSPQELLEKRESIRTQLDELSNAGRNRGEIEQARDTFLREYRKLDQELSAARAKSGAKLAKAISQYMNALGMNGGQFAIEVSSPSDTAPTLHGTDTIEFLVTANAGQSLRPLAKVASGGELSRISLALQVVASQYKSAPTLIFDEVDSGIGGATAEKVGRHLRQLGSDAQVLCVTHLAQVASQGQQHFVVSKHQDGAKTRTAIRELNPAEKVEEVARMAGGIEITDASRRHAKKMLADSA